MGIGHDAGTDVEMHEPCLTNRRANGDAQLAFTVKSEITMAAAVGPARDRFKFVNDFHRPEFWCSGDAAAGKTRSQRGKMGYIVSQPAFDGRDQVLHLRKPFEPRKLRD